MGEIEETIDTPIDQELDLDTATAHRDWDTRWQSDSGRQGWLDAEADVIQTALPALQERGARALDLGCGVGRHSLFLARQGFDVTAMDGSPAGLDYARAQAAEAGLEITFAEGFMTDLPFADAAFDYILSWNVIYHGDGPVVRRAIDEIRRVLRPGGLYQGTMLSKRHGNFGLGREVAPDTWQDDAADSDKSHPHFYCNAAELTALFAGFEPFSLFDQLHEGPESWHWHLVAERL